METARAAGHGREAYERAGITRWLFTTDHREIGLMYIWTAFFFFITGGILALLVRAELATVGETIVDADTYNGLFTTHALTMVFLWTMPVLAGFGNYFVPLMIKAPDMAFPRVNAFSYWLIPPGGILLYAGTVLPNVTLPDVGWTLYAPLSVSTGGAGITMAVLGLQLLGIASTGGAINFIVTILKMRAPGVTFHKMPLFVWAQLTTALLLLFALPVLAVALSFVYLDRTFGTHFYDADVGGALLWQNLFWFFGHPEVYIMIIPAMGIISEVLPKFSGRPIFGYNAIAYSTLAIGVLGYIVWGHHMFVTGIDPRVRTVFMINTMIIGVPTGVKIFNWIATMWGGRVRYEPPMLFAIGFLAMFIIGGLDGVFLAAIPVDYNLTDTYWVVAHIHYVLFGGSVFGIFAGIYYWFPRMTDRMYNKALAHIHFWLTLIGFNVTFLLMHQLGTEGMPRRVADYLPEFEQLNMLATVGAFILGFGQVFFFANMLWSLKHGKPVTEDPWGGLERPEWQYRWHAPAPGVPGHPVAAPAGAATEARRRGATEEATP